MVSTTTLVLGIFFLIGGLSLLHRGRGGKMTRQGCIAVVLGFTILGCSMVDIFQSLSTPFLNLLPSALPTPVPTIFIPTPEPSYVVKYFLDLNVNAICIDDDHALERLQFRGVFVSYTDFSSGERELKYDNQGAIGLPPSDFPWSYQFSLKASNIHFGERLYVQGEMPITTFDSCHALTCKILVDGIEVENGTSIVKDNVGRDRATKFAECAIWFGDLDLD